MSDDRYMPDDWRRYRRPEDEVKPGESWPIYEFDEDVRLVNTACVCDPGIDRTEDAFSRLLKYTTHLEKQVESIRERAIQRGVWIPEVSND